MDDDIDELIKTLASTPDTAALAKAQELLTKLKIENPKIKELEAAFATASAAGAGAGASGSSPASTGSAAPVVKLTQDEEKLLNEIKENDIISTEQKGKLEAIAKKLKDSQKEVLNTIAASAAPLTPEQITKLKDIIANPTMAGGRRKRHKSRKNRKLKKYKSKKRR